MLLSHVLLRHLNTLIILILKKYKNKTVINDFCGEVIGSILEFICNTKISREFQKKNINLCGSAIMCSIYLFLSNKVQIPLQNQKKKTIM